MPSSPAHGYAANELSIVPLPFACSQLVTGEFTELLPVFCFALFGIYVIITGVTGAGGLFCRLALFVTLFIWNSRQGYRRSDTASA